MNVHLGNIAINLEIMIMRLAYTSSLDYLLSLINSNKHVVLGNTKEEKLSNNSKEFIMASARSHLRSRAPRSGRGSRAGEQKCALTYG